MPEERRLTGLDAAGDGRETVEAALFEMKRVIAGQDEMLERVLVCLLAGGHLLIEGVPGLAKTLTIRTAARVLGGTFQRIQFTPDLVPADLVGTRIYRPNTGTFDTELGPVFTNFLLADEINRAPAKVQSALLEVMQEQTVTIGGTTHIVERPFLVMATQNPIESEGTYPLPEAQVDRFMLKVLVDYPAIEDEHTVAQRALEQPVDVQRVIELPQLLALQAAVADVYVDPAVTRYAVRLASVTRDLAGHGLPALDPFVVVRRQPARADQHAARRARARRAARPPLRAALRRARAGTRRDAPPPRALVPRTGRGRQRRGRDRPRARDRARCRASSSCSEVA